MIASQELQQHTSEIITDREKVSFTTGPVLKLLIMLLLLLSDKENLWKRSSLSGYLWLLQYTEYLQWEATDSTKKIETPGTLLQK